MPRLGWAVVLMSVLAGAAPALASDSPSATELAARSFTYADPSSLPGKTVLTPDDEKFLDDLQRRGIQFYIDEADPVSGLMPDRSPANGSPSGGGKGVCSIASVGFGLTALCIGAERGWISKDEAYERCLRPIKFLYEKVPHEHGYYYHFINMRTGAREWNCEVSNIDTALLMTGVLFARQYFPDTELAKVANDLYERVEWDFFFDEKNLCHTGYKPESGLGKGTWSAYSECPVLVCLIGLGSGTHPLKPETWNAWRRDRVITYAGLTFVQCPPLFTHQFPQCWFDLRGLRDDHADYFRNAQLATIAQREWMKSELSKKYPKYGPNMWGLTASDYEKGYTAWGGPPAQGPIDGSVVPCAPAGSLAFEPRICLDALKEMKQRYGAKGYVKYGFVDAFNPHTGWYNDDVIGIDVGPTVLMAENCRSGFVWKTFMSAPEAQRALKAAGLRPLTDEDREKLSNTSVLAAPSGSRAAGEEK
jgi:hypothetical protein